MSQQVNGMMTSLKETFSIDAVNQKLTASKKYIVDILLFGGGGFVAGYLFKRFSLYVVTAVITCIILALLQHVGFVVITINWAKVHSFLGISVADIASDNIFNLAWQWSKMHVVAAISFSIGFLVGFRSV